MKRLLLGLCLVLAGSVANAAAHTVGKAETKVELNVASDVATFDYKPSTLAVVNDNVVVNTVSKPSITGFGLVTEIFSIGSWRFSTSSTYRERLNSMWLPDKRQDIYNCTGHKD